jgi:hypothetical protein
MSDPLVSLCAYLVLILDVIECVRRVISRAVLSQSALLSILIQALSLIE